jgi:PBSX family phage terminase large subunit
MSNLTKSVYIPNPAQAEFHSSNKKYRFYSGGIRSGKTFAGGQEALYHVVKYPKSAALVVSPTFGMMRDSTLATFMEICPIDLIGKRRDGTLNYNKDTHDIIMYNGSIVRFRSADDPNKIRGMEVSFFWLDEGGQLPDDEMWKIGIGRMSQKCAPQKAICTTTPNGMNWMYDFFIARKENRGLVSVHYAKTIDNAMNLPRGYIESLESQYTGNFFKQELLGEFVGFEGLVYPEFSIETHVTDNMPRPLDIDINIGMDFGYTDPTVMLAIGKDKADNRYVFDELYFTNIPLESAKSELQRFVSKYSPKKIWADPSRPDLIRQMELWGFNIAKANNDILGGIMSVSHYLKVRNDGRPRLFISPNCTNLISEFQMYRYNDKKKGEKPLDKYNHCLDSLRYGINLPNDVPKDSNRFRNIRAYTRRWKY